MKKDWQDYRDTKMLGVYHPENAVLRKAENGEVIATFRDTAYWDRDEGAVRERKMLIGGKCFHITSVFPDVPTATPTDKLLTLINTELEKENYSA